MLRSQSTPEGQKSPVEAEVIPESEFNRVQKIRKGVQKTQKGVQIKEKTGGKEGGQPSEKVVKKGVQKKGKEVQKKAEEVQKKDKGKQVEKIEKKRKRKVDEDELIDDNVVNLSDDEEVKDDKLTVRVGHVKFMKFVSNLTPLQKQAVEDMGFGAFLSVNLPQNDAVFCAWLLKHFEENSSTLYLPLNKTVEITEQDVQIVYGVPRGNKVVTEKEPKKTEEEDEDLELVTPLMRWREMWGCKTGSPRTQWIFEKYESEEEKKNKRDQQALHKRKYVTADIESKEKNTGEATEMFKIDFLVLAVNSMMKTSQNLHCHYKFLHSIQDCDEIKELNWCKYVLQSLISTVPEWKQNTKGFFKGPLPFLLVCF